MRVDVVLLRHIKNLGGVGTVFSVRRGYANFLLRSQMALRATKANLAYFEKQKEHLQKLSKDMYDQAVLAGQKLDGVFLEVIREAGDTGQLYGSVSAKDLVVLLAEKGVKELKPSAVHLSSPVKTTGVHAFMVHLHPEVEVLVHVAVAKTANEAAQLITLFQEEEKKAESEKALLSADAAAHEAEDPAQEPGAPEATG
jgi:large subunit ribosomal protein L9